MPLIIPLVVSCTPTLDLRALVLIYICTDAIEMMFVGIGMICLFIGVVTYPRINARRAAALRERTEAGIIYTAEELRAMGDRAPDFVYTI